MSALTAPVVPALEPAVPVFRPFIDGSEIAAVQRSLEVGWLGMGAAVGEFEQALHRVLELSPEHHVVAVNTGHSALHLALLVAGVGAGDEVVTPSFNNIADFQAILACGAEPVFCDIDPVTLCIDPRSAEEACSARTKAIIAMDYACSIADHGAIGAIAQRRGARVIHDAAHSFGSRCDGRMIGSQSDVAIFSFDPVKNITTIDGGAIVVSDRREASALREMRLIGMGQPTDVMYRNQRAWTYDVQRPGWRYHMANLHAAIGLVQLGKLDEITRTRRAACLEYSEALRGVTELSLPPGAFTDVTPFIYFVRVQADRRDAFREHLHAGGIDTGIHWQPGHWFSLFRSARRVDLSVTERVGREIVTLPLHSGMSRETIERIVQRVRGFFRA